MPWRHLYLGADLEEAIVARKASVTRDKRRLQSSRRRDRSRTYTLPFQSRQYQMFGVGLLSILAGFITLGLGSISFAPLLMVLGYCIVIPLIFFWKADIKEAATSDRGSPQP